MANIFRSAKSGYDWTINEINAYNIVVTLQDIATFFGHPILPQPSVHQVILDNEKYPVGGIQDTNDRMFFYYLGEVMAIPPGEESAVDDFCANLLTMPQYNALDNRYIRQRKDIPFFICGTDSHAKTDLWQKRSPPFNLTICVCRVFDDGLLDRRPFAASLWLVPCPHSTRLPLRKILSTSYKSAIPGTPTTVHKLLPPVADITELARLGMRPLDNRAVILSCFEAFKQFL